MCKSSPGVVEQRYNFGKNTPTLLVANNPSYGLTNQNVTISNSWLSCSFTRTISDSSIKNYFDLNKNYYILAAYGRYTVSSDTIAEHRSTDCSSKDVDFSSISVYSNGEAANKYKVHACLMIIAWLALASTGILIARYYKYVLPKAKLCGVQFWFNFHRIIMIFVTTLSIVSFIIILSQLNWSWVSDSDSVSYTHSIFGILTICLSIIQVFLLLNFY